MNSQGENLPTPYAHGIEEETGVSLALARRIAARDAGRKFWTRFVTIKPSQSIRFWFSVAAPSSAGVILTDWEYSSVEVAIGLFSILTVLLIPTNFAAAFARMSAKDRLQLRAQGLKSKASYPGVERIINTLDERILRERVRILTSLMATLSLLAILNIETGQIVKTILVSLAILFGAISWMNTFQLEGSIPMRSNSFPLLSLHAPTLHDSILSNVLSEVLLVHLDPETASDWDEWVHSLSLGVREGMTSKSAVEEMLVSLHLNYRGRIDDEEMMSQIKRVFKVSTIDRLVDTDSKFNIDSIQRLLAHTRAWQPGLFRLTDRLQDSMENGKINFNDISWRMDVDLQPRCSDGQGALFVMLHNSGEADETVEVEIVTAEGEPEFQNFRLPVPRLQGGEKQTLAKLLNTSLVLWIGLAWPDSESGSHPVQVMLKGEDGVALTSMVVYTTLTSRLHPESVGMKMTDAAEEVRKLALSVQE
jgi:hypothetical protein